MQYKLESTTDYRIFERDPKNRDVGTNKALKASLEKHGCRPSLPIACKRKKNGKLLPVDGQHRINFAEALGLPVWYVVDDEALTSAQINRTARPWKLDDFAKANTQKADYALAISFADEHGIGVSQSVAMLSGQLCVSHVRQKFIDGEWEATHLKQAAAAAAIYDEIKARHKKCAKSCLMKACQAVCRVADFDHSRLLRGIALGVENLQPYATLDSCLAMLEKCYNHRRSAARSFSLKSEALKALASKKSA